MDTSKLTPFQRAFRMNVRNFLLAATMQELEREVKLSLDRGDEFRAECVRDLIGTYDA